MIAQSIALRLPTTPQSSMALIAEARYRRSMYFSGRHFVTAATDESAENAHDLPCSSP